MSISAIRTEVDLPKFEEVKHYFYTYILTTYDVVDSVSDALNPEKIKQPSLPKSFKSIYYRSLPSTKVCFVDE